MEISDEQLIGEYLRGDEQSLEILIKRYLNQIFAFSLKFSKDKAAAQDIAQDTFVKVWKKIGKFDADKKFKPWLFTIAKNTALDYLKQKRLLPFSELEAASGLDFLSQNFIDSALRPDEQSALAESVRRSESIIAALTGKYRQVVVLRHEGFSFREIGLKLGEPLHTVKSRYRRALIILKKSLANTD
ncbi:MAG: sigma-70 family RNA polymerase sigma factor [Patescibacteria group bacterium]